MAPKSSKKNTKKGSDNEDDPGYAAKRARNNEVNKKKAEIDSRVIQNKHFISGSAKIAR